MNKKILSKSLLMISIMIIVIFSSIPKVSAATKGTLSCSGDLKIGGSFSAILYLPSDVYGADFTITVKYSDGSTDSKKIAYVNGFQGYNNTGATFTAKAAGTATVTASGINLSDSSGNSLESNGSTSINITIADNTVQQPPTPTPTPDPTPTPPTTPNNNNNNNNNNATTNNNDKATFSDVNETVYTTERVNLRKNYSTSSEKISTLSKDTKLTRTGISSNGWSRVNYNGQTGYIFSQYLTAKAEAPKEEKPQEIKIKEVKETMYASQNCNLRKSWSTDSEKAGYLTKGQEITRTGIVENGWSRLEYKGNTVYVKSSLISKEKPAEEPEEKPEESEQTTEEIPAEKTELQILQEEIGVLPEVGNNVATITFSLITVIALIVSLIGLYYIKRM
jgi:uncharacterized protein YgiM (DUF1202 family)